MLELIPFGGYSRSMLNHIREMDNLARALFSDSMFSDSSINDTPAVSSIKTDIKKTEDGFVLEAELPGFNKKDISVDVENDTLTIKAERHSESEENDKKDSFVRIERSYGLYQRSFNVKNIDTDGIKAKYENGLLVLNLPSKAPVEPPAKQLAIE